MVSFLVLRPHLRAGRIIAWEKKGGNAAFHNVFYSHSELKISNIVVEKGEAG